MDIEFLLMLQKLREAIGNGWVLFFEKMTLFGEVSVTMIILAIVYWCVEKKVGTYFFLGWSWNRIINGFLKITACVYRPWIRDTRIMPNADSLKTATGYSFPSGHSTNAGTLFGGLLVDKRNSKMLRIFALVMILLIMFSRNFLGVHTPQDVIVGATLSTIGMFFTLFVIDYMDKKANSDIIIAIISLMIAIVVAIYANLKKYPVDLDANGNVLVEGAKMAKDTYKAVGINIAFFLGIILERRFVKFSTEGKFSEKIVRAGFGLLGYYFINNVIGDYIKNFTSGPSTEIIIYFILVFYIIFLYPMVTKKFEKK